MEMFLRRDCSFFEWCSVGGDFKLVYSDIGNVVSIISGAAGRFKCVRPLVDK